MSKNLIFFTVVEAQPTPGSLALESSVKNHHPEARFFIVTLAELAIATQGIGGIVSASEIMGSAQFEFASLLCSSEQFEVFTVVRSLKYFSRSADVVVYVSESGYFFDGFETLLDLEKSADVLLLPRWSSLEEMDHCLAERTGWEFDESQLVYPGFIALSSRSDKVLDWLVNSTVLPRMLRAKGDAGYILSRVLSGLVCFDRTLVVNSPSVGLGYWNLKGRNLMVAEDSFRVESSRLILCYFEGFDYRRPYLATIHHSPYPNVRLSERPEAVRLYQAYADVIQRKENDASQYRFELGHLVDIPIPLFILSYLRKAVIGSPNVLVQLPFDKIAISSEEGKQTLAEWLMAPNGDTHKSSGITNLHLAAYDARTDVSNAYPDILQNDNLSFREWFKSFGITELKVDTFLPATTLKRFLDDDLKLLHDRQNGDSYDLTVVGYLSRALGIGEDARRILNAAKNSIRGSVVGFDYERSASEVQYPGYRSVSNFGTSRANISIVCVNADNLEQFAYEFPTVFARSNFKVGRWAWELDEMPSWMSERQYLLDELWVYSGFIANALRKSVSIPVHVVPPVLFNGEDQVDLESQQTVTFLYIFDYLSGFERKNPLGLVRAFRQAFPVEGSARLILKSVNSSARFAESEKLRFAIKDRSDIELVDRYLDVQEMSELYSRASCYVSLHRSEGVGLTMAEAMARGIPVIATGYGGNLEFMDASVALINSYDFVKVGEDNVPYPADSDWAEPNVNHAATSMQMIASDLNLRVEMGLAGRNHLQEHFDEYAIAALLERNIQRISRQHSVGRN